MNLQSIIEKRLSRSHTKRADKLQLINSLRLPSDVILMIKQFYFDTIKSKADNDRDIINYLFTFVRFTETIPIIELWLSYRKITISDRYGCAHESCQIDLGSESQGHHNYDLYFVNNSPVVKKYWIGNSIVEQKRRSWTSNICSDCGNFILRNINFSYSCNC